MTDQIARINVNARAHRDTVARAIKDGADRHLMSGFGSAI
jgi:hypothetical protein